MSLLKCVKSRQTRRRVEAVINVFAYVLTLVIESAIMWRHYFAYGDWLHTNDCRVQVAIISLANVQIFRALFLASTGDCGKAP